MRKFEGIVPGRLDGKPVEKVLRQVLGLSPTRIKRAKFLPDGILVDGVRVFTDHIVHTGQKIMVNLPEQEETQLVPTPGGVDILYEDDWLLAVNKPAGLATHPGPGHYADTLGNRVTWLFAQRGERHVFRPVNRLDKGTSGILLLAKSAESHERLQNLLHTPKFHREYLALTHCCPSPEFGVVDAPIAAVQGELNKYYVNKNGKHAITDYEVLYTGKSVTLLRLLLHTGRTHQIRVHMAHIGCPLLGDKVYGGADGLDRPALHSLKIRLTHPFTGEVLELTAPVPEDMSAIMEESNL